MTLLTSKPVLEMTNKEFEIIQEFFKIIVDDNSWYEKDESLITFLTDCAYGLEESQYFDFEIVD